MRRTSLPILNPCHVDWDAMTGDDRRRHCTECAQDVVDLSALTERAARALLGRNQGERLCVRYEHDARGDIVFARPVQGRRLPVAALVTALAACTANPEVVEPLVAPDPAAGAPLAEPDPTAAECVLADDDVAGQCDLDDPALQRIVIDVVVEAKVLSWAVNTTVSGSRTMGIPVIPPRELARRVEPPADRARPARAPRPGSPQRASLEPLEPLTARPERPWDDDELDPAARAAAIVKRTLR